jgi:serine/threonine protein kinase
VYSIFGQLIGSLKALFDNFKVSHWDIKPANIYITKDNIVILIDFGLAKRPESTTVGNKS